MIAIRREFVVEVAQETAWRGVAQIERWPSWLFFGSHNKEFRAHRISHLRLR
jgi:hypothetical protein